jgi:hypothetical protein
MKKPFAVWETEYPDEGSSLYLAYSESGARRKWRKDTRTTGPVSEQPPLSVAELTTEQALAHVRSA